MFSVGLHLSGGLSSVGIVERRRVLVSYIFLLHLERDDNLTQLTSNLHGYENLFTRLLDY